MGLSANPFLRNELYSHENERNFLLSKALLLPSVQNKNAKMAFWVHRLYMPNSNTIMIPGYCNCGPKEVIFTPVPQQLRALLVFAGYVPGC